jgi:predicted transglutaminase-like cysteine proteinase
MLTAKATVPAYAMTPHETSRPKVDPKVSSSLRGIFGAIELRTNAARGAERWPEVMKRATKERREWLACDRDSKDCPAKLKAWREGLVKAKGLTRWQQIVEVNRLVNSLVLFRNDIDRYGVADHWATPKEALLKSGDCEDYAILKYLSLRELGFKDKDMRMVVLKITRRGIGHAVLAVNHDGGRYILDNLAEKPVEHSVVKGYQPIYSVNARGQWLALQVKPTTTQVASLEPVMPSRKLVEDTALETTTIAEDNGLKLPAEELMASGWDQPVTLPLPRVGWAYALSQPVNFASAEAQHAHPLPRI